MDEHCFVRELSILSEPLISLKNEASEGDADLIGLIQNELDALDLYPRSFVMNRETYKRRMPAYIDAYSQEKLDYYAERFAKTINLQLKSRYGDILLDYQGKNEIENKYNFFCKLVPLLSQIAKIASEGEHAEYLCTLSSLSRAVELCLNYNNKGLLKKSIQGIIDFLSEVGRKYNYRWVIEPTDILLEVLSNSKMNSLVDGDITQLVLKKLNEAREFWLEEKNHHLHRWACYCLVAWNNKLKQPVNDLNLEIGLSFELESEHQQGRPEKTEGVKAGFLQMALCHYLKIGATSKVNKVKVKLRKAYLAEQEKEFKAIMTPIMIPEGYRQHIEKILTCYRDLDSVEKMIQVFACDPNLMINVPDLYQSVEAHLKEDSLGAGLPKSVITEGRRIAQATEYEEQKEMKFRRMYCGRLEEQSIFFLMPIFEIMKGRGLTAEIFVQKYHGWDFYQPKRKNFIKTGFERFFAGDYISALHILVPQFEGCLRNMFFSIDIPTTVIKEGNLQHEQVFGEFLNRQEVKETLGRDLHIYIETVMVNPNGWNIRNDIAHGIVSPVIFTTKYAIIILHLFCKLLNVSISKTD